MRVAFDIGGTFTDVLTLDADGHVRGAKVLSLIDRVADDILELAGDETIDRFVHATTICSNAIIEGKAAQVGIITTQGFRDTLEMRGQKGPAGSSKDWVPPAPLVRRSRCVEVVERMRTDGEVVTPLDEATVHAAIDALLAFEVDAIAVCLINSYANGAHEKRIGDIIAARAPGTIVCLSSEILPEVREYERTSTTVVNSALIPVVNDYLDKLESRLDERSDSFHIMQSNGGIMTAAAARLRPMSMLESGPAAGVLAAARLAQTLGIEEALAFDMGGTTAKACYIADGRPSERASAEVAAAATIGGRSRHEGYAVRVPTVDLVEVGAGGGSIAWLDHDALRVGPASAGANPGPVAYGRGGTQPTVTDANIVLGRINADAIADGQIDIDIASARRAIGELADHIGMDLMQTAHGITLIANAVMMRALRAVSTERGYDPRRCTLISFGGAGSLHAAALAESMGIDRIIVPPRAGVFSALGLLLADYRIDYVRSIIRPIDASIGQTILDEFEALKARARDDFDRLGVARDGLRFECQVDMRYPHQIDDMAIRLPEVAAGSLAAALVEQFRDTHAREFGFAGTGTVLAINLRLRALAPAGELSFEDMPARREDVRNAPHPTTRKVYFGEAVGAVETPIVSREDIGAARAGPLIVEEPDTTVVVPPGWTAARERNGCLLLSRQGW